MNKIIFDRLDSLLSFYKNKQKHFKVCPLIYVNVLLTKLTNYKFKYSKYSVS